MRDAELFKARLGPLYGGAEVSELLIHIVQEKTTTGATAPEAAVNGAQEREE
jgi:hypothetical protein